MNVSESVKVCSDLCGFVRIYVDLYEVAGHDVNLCVSSWMGVIMCDSL